MCGINLIIDKNKSLSPDIIRSMTELTNHRGPDEVGIKIIEHQNANYLLGVNRLKITDQSSAARQPFLSKDKKFALLFNGEIYNYSSLKNRLLNHGIQFDSHSDTEVLFHWLKIFGKNGIHELNGMFAFIFIDFETDDVVVARDRFGIKPVYYFHDDRYVIVSSEIQPIVQAGLVDKKLNEIQLKHYLRYKYVCPPETLYKNVFEILPGNILNINDTGFELENITMHSESSDTDNIDLSKIEDLLKDSLLQQLTAPVPVGLLLSGGVDSTLLLALAKHEGFSLPSFSIVNAPNESTFGTDDYRYANKAARLYGSEHNEVKVDISILNQFDSFIKKMDQPIGDSSYIMTSQICSHASSSMKVLLSGAGADELFGGYNRHWAFYQYLKYKNSLNRIMPAARFLSGLLPTGIPLPFRKRLRMINKFARDYDNAPAITFQNFLSYQEFGEGDDENPTFKSKEKWLRWALDLDLKNFLVSDVLALSDKASMQHGIELRVPYLSEELVNYLQKGRAEYLLKNGRKWILKELLIKYEGKEFATRPKEGFGLPLSHWLMDKQVKHLWEFKADNDQPVFKYLDRDLLDSLVLQQKQQKADHGPILWSILVLAHWLNHHFG